MISAHIAGMPIEETLAMGGPAVLTALGALGAQLRARLAAPGADDPGARVEDDAVVAAQVGGECVVEAPLGARGGRRLETRQRFHGRAKAVHELECSRHVGAVEDRFVAPGRSA
jgi:hypothetical protein